MKIILIHTGADLYGASRSALRLTSKLRSEGNEVLVVLPHHGPLETELINASIPVRIDTHMPLFLRSKWKSAQDIILLANSILHSFSFSFRLIREFRPDIVHTNTAAVFPTTGIAARLTGKSHLWHIRETFEDFPVLWSIFKRIMNCTANHILAVSRPIAEQFGNPPPSYVSVLHNGFPKTEFEPRSKMEIQAFRDRFGLGQHLTAGIVGRIKLKRKGQETFVQAASLLTQEFPDARFLIIGSPFPGNEPHLEEIQNLIRSLHMEEKIILTGDVTDPKVAISALDVMVLASAQNEPFAGVVIEAMALGIPVVGTRIGGTIEQIDDGITGILIPPSDPPVMAAAMKTLFQNPALRTHMAQAARKRFESSFEFEPFYAKMLTIYKSLIRK